MDRKLLSLRARSVAAEPPLALASREPETAFRALLPDLPASLRPLFARMGIPARDRDDLVQDVLLAAHTSLPRFRPALGSMRAWVHGIAFHLATHERARARHRREQLEADAGLADADAAPPPDERIAGEEARALVRATLDELAPGDRRVLVSHDADGLAMARISAALGVPLSTAYKWLYRARSRLREALARKDRRQRVEALYRPFRGLFGRRGGVYVVRERAPAWLERTAARIRLARRLPRRAAPLAALRAARRFGEAVAARAAESPPPVPFPRFGGPARKKAFVLWGPSTVEVEDRRSAAAPVPSAPLVPPRPYPQRPPAPRRPRLAA